MSSTLPVETILPNLLTAGPNTVYPDLVLAAQVEAQQNHKSALLLGPFAVEWAQDDVGVTWENFYLQGARAVAGNAALERLRGQNVVELGCGPELRSFQQQLGRYEPASYIGIDHSLNLDDYPTTELSGVGSWAPLHVEGGAPCSGVLVKADMLDVVSRLPDGYGSYVINGIDDAIISSKSPYAIALMNEIARTTKRGGAVLGITFGGGILTELPHHTQMEAAPVLDRAVLLDSQRGLFCYTKP